MHEGFMQSARWGCEIKIELQDSPDYTQFISETSDFIKMSSTFLQLSHADGRTESNEGNKRQHFLGSFPELPQTVTELMYIAAGWWYRETERLLCPTAQQKSIFTVQIL